MASFGGRLGQQLKHALGEACHLVYAFQEKGPTIGGVEDVVAEAGGQFSQLLVGGIEGLLRFAAKADPAQVHVPQFGRQDALLGAIQAPLALQGPQGGVDRAALASTVAEGHHRRLLAGVGGAQLGGVTNPV